MIPFMIIILKERREDRILIFFFFFFFFFLNLYAVAYREQGETVEEEEIIKFRPYFPSSYNMINFGAHPLQ